MMLRALWSPKVTLFFIYGANVKYIQGGRTRIAESAGGGQKIGPYFLGLLYCAERTSPEWQE